VSPMLKRYANSGMTFIMCSPKRMCELKYIGSFITVLFRTSC